MLEKIPGGFTFATATAAGMELRMRIGFIGCGKMATALAEGVVKARVLSPSRVCVSDCSSDAQDRMAAQIGAETAESNLDLVQNVDAIMLCVKPGDAIAALEETAEALAGKLVISIVAGLSLRSLQNAAGSGARIIRVMPNTPALVGKGAAAYAVGEGVTAEDCGLVEKLFAAVGTVAMVKEALLDAVTGLSGSGPAYVYVLIEALADAGVQAGLPRELALQLAAQTVAGSAEMVLQTGIHPAQLKDMVTSPGGTTIAGLAALEAGGFRAAALGAVRAAVERSKELGAGK